LAMRWKRKKAVGIRMAAIGAVLPNIRYLYWPLQLRARDSYRPSGRMTAVFIALRDGFAPMA
jgi:hypothetical protein